MLHRSWANFTVWLRCLLGPKPHHALWHEYHSPPLFRALRDAQGKALDRDAIERRFRNGKWEYRELEMDDEEWDYRAANRNW